MLRSIQRTYLSDFNYIKCVTSTCYSTQPAAKKRIDNEEQIQEFEKTTNITQRTRVKKPQRPPFVKNLLLGIFDYDILAYPELHTDDWDKLQKDIKQIKNILQGPEFTESTTLSKQVLKKLGGLKLLGLQGPQLAGCREVNVTESLRFIEEITKTNFKNEIVYNESLGIQTILKCGSDKLKKKYLHPLINGEMLSAICLLEPNSNNVDALQRTAILSGDGKTWTLNGCKKIVMNADVADLFIVIAHSDSIINGDINDKKLTVFLVERDFGGVTTKKQNVVNSNIKVSDITFENTSVPAENVIGSVGMAEKILTTIYPEYRLSTGSICSTLNKNLITKIREHYINISEEPTPLYETDAVQEILGKVTVSQYAMDSMIYLTTGLMDNYENQDCELEATIVKVFTSEQTLLNTTDCLNLLGVETILDNHWCNKLHTEALCNVTLNDPNANLKILISLFGLRFAGLKMNDLIKKLRNPLFHAPFIFKRMWTHRLYGDDNPKLNLYLHHYLHPSLITASNHLEYCVLRLQYATEVLLSRYGQDVLNRHMELRRLAECIIDVYAMTACISRASRSYCIGLQHGSFEVALATTFCTSAMERVKYKIKKITDGPNLTNDQNYRAISKLLFKFKGYFPVHPLTRNF